MRLAISTWKQRVAPVFDTARQARVFEVEEGRILGEEDERLPEGSGVEQLAHLAAGGVRLLICGGISRATAALASVYAIRVVPFIAGEVNEVIQAWLTGAFQQQRYRMPGCGRERRGCRRRVGGWGNGQ